MLLIFHWGRKNIEKELQELTGMAVKAGNDAEISLLLVKCGKQTEKRCKKSDYGNSPELV